MDVRQKMMEHRDFRRVSLKTMAIRCGISTALLNMVEHGEVTHPKIARRIQKEYGLSESEYKELIPRDKVICYTAG